MIRNRDLPNFYPEKPNMKPKGLENLVEMEYPGRFFIVGRDRSDQYNAIAYGLTGKQPSSRTRRLERDHAYEVVRIDETDQRNAALLVHPAMAFNNNYIAIGNGVETELIYQAITNHGKEAAANPQSLIQSAFREPVYRYDPKNGWVDVTSYEPDKSATPRIATCVGKDTAAFCIVRKHGKYDAAIQEMFAFNLRPGRGNLISTYSGKNMNPLPSFDGKPLPVRLPYKSAREMAGAVYDALAPKTGDDLRVAVACIFTDKETNAPVQYADVNRNKRGAQ
jgi:IMP cyclohydrolase